jgi:hypothetical protein
VNRDEIRATKKARQRQRTILDIAIRAEAARAGFRDPAGAVLLIDPQQVTVTEDGHADMGAVRRLLDQAAAQNPDLADPDGASTPPPAGMRRPLDGLSTAEVDALLYPRR